MSERVVFRRATPKDAYELARATFLADERVDLGTLASELGISRATLHRWVGSRENLLDQVLGELADQFFALSRAQARGGADDVIVETTRILAFDTAGFEPVRGFVAREPELALRLLLGERSQVRRRLLANLEKLIAEVLPDEADDLRGFAETVVQVGISLSWATLVAGDEPDAEQTGQVARALLAGARAGDLPFRRR
jgi:AcrR family transcriptional regulator